MRTGICRKRGNVKNGCKIVVFLVGDTKVQRDKVKIILNKFAEVLSGRIGRTNLIEHEIRLIHPQSIALNQAGPYRTKHVALDSVNRVS